ncbi:MAG: hypothetical protein GX213_10450 [Clostridiaceae bacterium]|nr:hypothetical protein [Clostridiaceae bacterium]
MESLRSLQRAAFTDVLDYGIFLFKKHLKKLFIINLIFNIPVILLLTIFNPVFTEQYWNLLNPTDIVAANPNEIFSSMFTMLFGSLALQGLYTVTLKNVMEGSIVKILYADTVLNQKKSIKQAVKECFSQFGTLLLGRMIYILIQGAVLAVLYIVLFIGVFSITFGILGLAVTSFTVPWVTVILSVLGIIIVIGAVFFISTIVGFYYGRYWMFLPAICVEQQKAGSSIGRCGNLGKNNFYLIGLSFTFGNIIVWLFPFIISSVFSIANLVSGSFDVELFRISTVITQIFSEILRPLLTCILTALYITLRVKREGLDIEIDLWQIKREELDRKKLKLQEAANAD